MRLSALLFGLPIPILTVGPLDAEISGITADSRKVMPGSLFVAYRGVDADGHAYIGDAIARGAGALVVERPVEGLSLPVVQVADGREALAWLGAAWFGYPGRDMRVVGITGTDGKTTTANLLFSILRAGRCRAGLISTVNAVIPSRATGLDSSAAYDTGLHTTTPDALDVHRYLAMMRDAGATEAVVEVTSHGLAQHRVTGCEFDVAVVTNITHEHLDYHGSFEAYREAKAMLFRSLMSGWHKPGVRKTAVLNRDDGSFDLLAGIPAERTISYGIGGSGEPEPKAHRLPAGSAVHSGAGMRLPMSKSQIVLTASNIHQSSTGSEFEVEMTSGRRRDRRFTVWPLRTPLFGVFNVYNILAATGAALALGLDVPTIQAGVRALEAVRGRMERVNRGQAFTAIVDFAHTPNALARALEAARSLTVSSSDGPGRVIVVFGCAGLRDREKRRLMGEAAARLADITIVTAEDPRTESLDEIMAETADALVRAGLIEGRHFVRIADRLRAVQQAVRDARHGDVVIVCGKGHEQSMCFGNIEYAWRDQDALAWALDIEQGRNEPAPFALPTWDASP